MFQLYIPVEVSSVLISLSQASDSSFPRPYTSELEPDQEQLTSNSPWLEKTNPGPLGECIEGESQLLLFLLYSMKILPKFPVS